MAQTPNQIMNQVQELMAAKRAKYEEEKEGLETPVESFPGAERSKPDTSDQTSDPEAANRVDRSLEGAGDDSPSTRGHAVESDESVKDPEKKPETQNTLDGDEAMKGKTAAELGNDMLKSIRDYQGVRVEESGKEAADKDENAESGEKAEKGAEAEKAENAESDESGGADKKAESGQDSNGKDDESGDKKAHKPLNMELTQDVLAKMAAITLSTEEGAEFMEKTLSKAAGAQAADELIGFVSQQEHEARKQAAVKAGAQDASKVIGHLRKQAAEREKLAYYNKGKEDALKSASGGRQQPAQQAAESGGPGKSGATGRSEKLAEAIKGNIKAAQAQQQPQQNARKAQDEYVKLGQAIADASIEEALGAQGAPQGAPEGLAPVVGPGMGGGAPAEGAPPEEAAGGLEDFSEEEIEAALEQLIAEGVITEEDVAQVLAILTGGAGGEEGAVPGPAESGGGEPAPEGAESAEGAEPEQKEEE